jgi:hypothetical protein
MSFTTMTVLDPKMASDNALLSVLKDHSDEVDSEDLELIAEEFARRGGDPEYLGVTSSFESYL